MKLTLLTCIALLLLSLGAVWADEKVAVIIMCQATVTKDKVVVDEASCVLMDVIKPPTVPKKAL